MKKYVTLLIITATISFADEFRDIKPVDNKLYTKECASCHFGFQAGLLPQKSWEKVMDNLKNHFGTDASLDSEDEKMIREYLYANSADKALEYKRSNKIMKYMQGEYPIQVTKTNYFVKEHNEIPQKLITQKEVKTLSNCTACHTKANDGAYSERYINIPNYGKYHD